MTAAIDRRSTRTAALAPPALLTAVAVAGHLAAPAGPARAVLVLPAVLWVPGQSLLSGLGLAGAAGRFRLALAGVLSVVALIAAGLLAYAVSGHVPLAVLPLWVCAALLPLNLASREEAAPQLLERARFGTLYCAGVLAAGALLWGVAAQLPTTPQQPYLSFSLGAPYTRVQGVLPVQAGQRLTVPAAVQASQAGELTGLTVGVLVDGSAPAGQPPAAVQAGADAASGTAQLQLTVPSSGCLHRVELVLQRAGTPIRSVDLYLRPAGGPACAGG
ncbi:hypothetical protein P3T37_001563 [Kitasatospora sp. MAA4]|uniref:hypothetical protein n=1 Tax=Kitasatospora sp. MAA4 TaxID=3035093 RepID=UPI002476439E|nr:hypothetical protein [Kitasatospora sp. MAA4]MDH6132178.1 hypothetical protein [Kitasatospora sp. MAA4]